MKTYVVTSTVRALAITYIEAESEEEAVERFLSFVVPVEDIVEIEDSEIIDVTPEED